MTATTCDTGMLYRRRAFYYTGLKGIESRAIFTHADELLMTGYRVDGWKRVAAHFLGKELR
jgi:hypothetical protein